MSRRATLARSFVLAAFVAVPAAAQSEYRNLEAGPENVRYAVCSRRRRRIASASKSTRRRRRARYPSWLVKPSVSSSASTWRRSVDGQHAVDLRGRAVDRGGSLLPRAADREQAEHDDDRLVVGEHQRRQPVPGRIR